MDKNDIFVKPDCIVESSDKTFVFIVFPYAGCDMIQLSKNHMPTTRFLLSFQLFGPFVEQRCEKLSTLYIPYLIAHMEISNLIILFGAHHPHSIDLSISNTVSVED